MFLPLSCEHITDISPAPALVHPPFQKYQFVKIQKHSDKNDPSRTTSPYCVKCLDPDKRSAQIPIQGHFSTLIVSHYSKRVC